MEHIFGSIEQMAKPNTLIIWGLGRGRRDSNHTNPRSSPEPVVLRQGQGARREWPGDKSQVESLPSTATCFL